MLIYYVLWFHTDRNLMRDCFRCFQTSWWYGSTEWLLKGIIRYEFGELLIPFHGVIGSSLTNSQRFVFMDWRLYGFTVPHITLLSFTESKFWFSLLHLSIPLPFPNLKIFHFPGFTMSQSICLHGVEMKSFSGLPVRFSFYSVTIRQLSLFTVWKLWSLWPFKITAI